MSILKFLTMTVLAWKSTWYPADKAPETKEQQDQRRSMVAREIISESYQGHTEFWPEDNAALTATIFKYESGNLEYHVHGGEESPLGTQDSGRARCLGQLHRNGMSEKEWKALAGRDEEATRRCIVKVQETLWYHAERCKLRRDIAPAFRWRAPLDEHEARVLFTAYWKGVSCEPSHTKGISARVGLFRQLQGGML